MRHAPGVADRARHDGTQIIAMSSHAINDEDKMQHDEAEENR
jgi:hypothetical protein